AHRGEADLGVYTFEGIPKTMGTFGGAFGSVCVTRLIQHSELRECFAAGELPQDVGAIGGRELALEGKGPAIALGDADVLYWNWPSPGGYGDPLTGDLDLVAADLASGAITKAGAQRDYGAVLGPDGGPDHDATSAERARRRRTRLAAAGRPAGELAAT